MHLSPKAMAMLNLPDHERQNAILATKWIGYTRAHQVTQKMKDLLRYPPSHRMPNLLVVGDTNNGKTVLLQHFMDEYTPYTREEDGRLIWPVLYVQAPVEPDERRFYNAIMDETGTPYRVADRADRKQRQVLQVIRHLEVKMLVIDEIQHILAGTMGKQRLFLNVLKHLSNELKIPFIGAGIRTASNAIRHDEQLANRFETEILQRWSMGEDYLRLLMSFERILPLRKASNLIEEGMAYKILSMSEGLLGEVSKILKRAAVSAINNQSECITVELLGKLDYTSPSGNTTDS